MPKKYGLILVIVILAIGSVLSACASATPTLRAATKGPPTSPPPTVLVLPTETLAPPTVTPPSPTSTLVPPTVTPTEEPVALNPSPRDYISMAYDSESKQVILYGGQTGDIFADHGKVSSETWAYDVNTQAWTEMKPPENPGKKAASELAYDAESDRIILFGGGSGLAPPGDTWAYDFNTNTWTKMNAQGPSKHLGARMAYDAESDRIVLFGGLNYDKYSYFQDTWAYDYNSDTWTEMKPAVSPIGQNYHAMTYNPKSDRVVLWGGDNTPFDPTILTPKDSSVWAYDYNTNTWQQKKTDKEPSPRPYHAIAYSDNADKVFMYGGTEGGSQEMQAYDFKTNTWKRLEVSGTFPGRLSRFAMVYIPDTDKFVLFGGKLGAKDLNFTNQTWIYDLNTNTFTDVTRNP